MSFKVNLSFKENDAELKLYSEVMTHSDKSGFIKDALTFYLRFKKFQTQLEEMEAAEKYRKYINM